MSVHSCFPKHPIVNVGCLMCRLMSLLSRITAMTSPRLLALLLLNLVCGLQVSLSDLLEDNKIPPSLCTGHPGIPGSSGVHGTPGHPGRDGRDGRDAAPAEKGEKGDRGQQGEPCVQYHLCY